MINILYPPYAAIGTIGRREDYLDIQIVFGELKVSYGYKTNR